ncbi:MAG: hypothetical protein FJ091_13665 [Deltaproteobacteria bacterium]|nr:hypothetical protein [Deltaproteobacteria bacterium]
MPAPAALQELAHDLARSFLGWKLREDYDALLALGEGALRIDLLTGETWCDDEPLPPLFIAGELAREVAKRTANARPELAQLDAAFAPSESRGGSPRRPLLAISCRVTLRARGEVFSAGANNGGA